MRHFKEVLYGEVLGLGWCTWKRRRGKGKWIRCLKLRFNQKAVLEQNQIVLYQNVNYLISILVSSDNQHASLIDVKFFDDCTIRSIVLSYSSIQVSSC